MSGDGLKRHLHDVLSDPVGAVEEIRGTRGLLSKLVRIILLENPREASRMSSYAKMYLDRKKSTIASATGSDAKHLNQGALYRDLGNPSMTFKTWLKAMTVLPVLKIKITAEITWKSKRVTEHHVEAFISEDEDYDGKDD